MSSQSLPVDGSELRDIEQFLISEIRTKMKIATTLSYKLDNFEYNIPV